MVSANSFCTATAILSFSLKTSSRISLGTSERIESNTRTGSVLWIIELIESFANSLWVIGHIILHRYDEIDEYVVLVLVSIFTGNSRTRRFTSPDFDQSAESLIEIIVPGNALKLSSRSIRRLFSVLR